jgi:hypothetical protein
MSGSVSGFARGVNILVKDFQKYFWTGFAVSW